MQTTKTTNWDTEIADIMAMAYEILGNKAKLQPGFLQKIVEIETLIATWRS
jgi:hypothetical protein